MNGDGDELAPTLTQAKLLRLAMDSLAYRARLWATLIISAGLFGAALFLPASRDMVIVRAVGAAVFTVLVHVPLWHKDREARGGER